MVNNNKVTSFVNALNGLVDGKEDVANKVTSISSSSTNTHYPTAKAVYDAINGLELGGGGSYINDYYFDDSTKEIVIDFTNDGSGGSGSGGSSVDIVTAWESTPSDSKVASEKLTKDTIDNLGIMDLDQILSNATIVFDQFNQGVSFGDGYLIYNHNNEKMYYDKNNSGDEDSGNELATMNDIPTKTSDLTNDGDGTNVFVKNNDSRLTDSRTPTSHTHGNLTNDGKVGSNANYIVVTGTGGAITSTQKLGNITYDGKIGSTSGKPLITTTSGTVTTGSFGSTSGTFAEGNHSHSGYVSATKVTSWSSTVSDSNVPSEKLVKDYIDNQIGTAIQYIQQ